MFNPILNFFLEFLKKKKHEPLPLMGNPFKNPFEFIEFFEFSSFFIKKWFYHNNHKIIKSLFPEKACKNPLLQKKLFFNPLVVISHRLEILKFLRSLNTKKIHAFNKLNVVQEWF